jgi:hypothetical protein
MQSEKNAARRMQSENAERDSRRDVREVKG